MVNTRILSPIIAALAISACGSQPSRSIRENPAALKQFAGISDYQIGPTWGKSVVKSDTLQNESSAFQRAAQATARVRLMFGGATGFVIGAKDGKVVLATNHHVIGDQSECNGARISFEMLQISGARCDKVLATSTDLDVTIFTIKGLSDDNESKLLTVARSFSTGEPKKGTELMTIGYGVAGNDGQKELMGTKDEDCKTYSPDGEMRFMADPDELNPGPYKTWMFATGCDVSHGDSGSAIFDRETGEVVGILSTGKIPKNTVVRETSFLKRIYEESDEAVWKELTYAVPASKIVELVGDDLP